MFKLTLFLLGCTIGSCLNLQHQQRPTSEIPPGDYTIEYSWDNISVESLSVTDQKISFKGCNYCASSYSFEDDFLQTGSWIRTRAYCEDSTDEALIEAIDNTDLVFPYDGKLYFVDTDISKTVLLLTPA